jgi:hypothetical protein
MGNTPRYTTARQRRQLTGLLERPITDANTTHSEAEALMGDGYEVELFRDVVQQHIEARRLYYKPRIDPPPTWPIWMTLTLGKHKGNKTLISDVKRAGYTLDRGSEIIIKGAELAKTEQVIHLALITLRQLGFGKNLPLDREPWRGLIKMDDKVWSEVKRHWLKPCPIEVVPLLCLQELDLSDGPLYPGMRPAYFDWAEDTVEADLEIKHKEGQKRITSAYTRPIDLDRKLIFVLDRSTT